MICPHCARDATGSKTVYSRATARGRRRRYLCRHCAKKFTTVNDTVHADCRSVAEHYPGRPELSRAMFEKVRGLRWRKHVVSR